MNRDACRANVIVMAEHPAARRRAVRAEIGPAPDWVGLDELPVDPRLAARLARVGHRSDAIRVTVFVRLALLHRWWRHCRRWLSLSRRLWALAKPATPFASPDGVVAWPKRSPHPAGAHPRRDFPLAPVRETPRGGGAR